MRVLIMSVTAGGGHNSTAAAIEAGLRAGGAECHVLDTLKYINSLLDFTVSEGYLFVTKRLKKLYGSSYRAAEKRRSTGDGMSAARLEWSILSRKLRVYLDEYDPDVIVFTHIFVGIMLDHIKEKWGLRAKTVGILTDFAFHPYWEEAKHLDFVVTADKTLDYQAFGKGYKPEQILPLGIPVNPKFAVKHDKTEMRKKLGLDPGKPVVLFMGGSMGYGNMADNVKRLDGLDRDFQIIAVCGSNKKALETMKATEFKKKVLSFGFVKNVDELMDASDFLITKPGGLTTSEALSKRLPMIIVNPIPGQEDQNTEFLLNNGAAAAVTKGYPLEEAVYNLVTSPERIRNMEDAISILRKPNATNDICRFVLNGCVREKEPENG